MFSEEVVISNISLDVPTDNYEEFDQEIDPALLGDKLEQSNVLRGSHRQFQFYRSNFLLLDVIEKKNAPPKKFHLNLAWLNPEAEHRKIIVWKWLGLSLLALAVSGVFLGFHLNNMLSPVINIVGGSLSLSAALIFFLIFIYTLRDEYIFYSHYANIPLFLMENRNPDMAQLDNFLIRLQQAVFQAQKPIPVEQRLIGELKMCRRLRDEKIIDEESYTRARGIIFKHKQYKA